ncbi:bifunctional 2-polyprenyl-6-hydroxyphenol methylase/3-demethylubiquinol 3-O-methyltransferase UbiG [Ferruginivarius sediminum]|uniref:Ubiquinone biosynthesis O-methyltransferase n=1 Tax=Ferruginivarius sediminum TaxID=2661937 RepID=A0A369T928_9PROT|nr:bifunctional 2-polyprenyl-6-hydroxyphenol methylase/3-demethylubiquinol 3-O-methyltransferase UbiG [Ferruginivarius sediminum]RDD60984.1 bifunctional 2-polyprenyl-6-hydroxyphenol methylase/3-demethylubiquinol 3-O-methyltransferase UbiG [Ferruginivarius sediminum]
MTETRAARPVTVDPREIGKFARMAERWWDPEGEMKPLHALNPVRVAYLRDRIAAHFGHAADSGNLSPLEGVSILDAGCGGGLLAEPLARLGARVTGIDAASETIKAAKAHAERQGLEIDYRRTTAEELADSGARFDAVLAMEIVEHVAELDSFLCACGDMVRPGGVCVVATLNRTMKSLLMAKIGAEYVLGWLPPGTHDWRKFVRPSEAAAALRPAGLRVREVKGVAFDPLRGDWHLSGDTDVNYMLLAEKP